MPVHLGTLTNKVHRDVETALKRLKGAADTLEGRVQALRDQVSGLPAPLTMDQIRAALASTGTHPLNVTGLIGAPATAAAIASGVPVPPPPGPPPPPPPVPPSPPPQDGTGLVRGGSGRLLLGGSLWPWRGTSDFTMYQHYLDGGDVSTVIADRVMYGANLVRVFGMYDGGVGHFLPSAYPNFYTSLPAFATLLRAAGMWLEMTVFADAENVMPSVVDQQTHFAAVCNALSGSDNVFIELGNEWPQNGFDPANFDRPVGILSSNGSNLGDGAPYLPAWDYGTYHPSRSDEWPRKPKGAQDVYDGYDGYAGYHRTIICDEPMGAANADQPGRRSTNTQDFFEMAATCQMFCGGATFHADEGISSVPFTGIQADCAAAFFQALLAVPVDAQTWEYANGTFSTSVLQHVDLPDPAGALRTYSKFTEHQAVVIAIRPGASWTPITQNGWTITSRLGPVGELVFCSR